MKYDKEQRLAMNQLRDTVGDEQVEELANQIIEPRDVRYYLDAFGDFELAVKIHPLPKDLPEQTLKEMGNYDVLGGWEGDVLEIECPCCERTLYQFPFEYDYVTVDEYGDNWSEHLYHLTDPAGFYWDTTEDHNFLCSNCANDRLLFPHSMDSHRGVKIFYGEENEWYPFSHSNGVVRWDAKWYMDNQNVIEINLRNDEEEIVGVDEVGAAFAGRSSQRDEFIESMGWVEITSDDLTCTTNGVRKRRKYAKEVMKKWGAVTDSTEQYPTHPEWNFTYIIEDGERMYVPEENEEDVLLTFNRMAVAQVNKTDKLNKSNPGEI